MFFKNFRVQVNVRVVVLAATITLQIYLLMIGHLYTTIVVLSILILLQVYFLIKFVDKTNYKLVRFFDAIEHSDFSQNFTGAPLGTSFKELNSAFNKVIEKFQNTRSEKEENLRYLETVMQHVGVGLIVYDQNGDVQIINNAAKKLLNVPNIPNIVSLNKIGNNIVESFFSLKAGDKKTIKLDGEIDQIQLVLNATEFKLRDKRFTLLSLQNIQSELEEKEMEAWQQLIRVLTHEIMNSITPISSLASTVNQILLSRKKSEATFDSETVEDINIAMSTIQRRSEALIHFVNNYRDLTKIPKPNFQIIQVKILFQRIKKLMDNDLNAKGIQLQTKVKPELLELTADSELIEQVIINLIINSLQALDGIENPEINLDSHLDDRGRVIIKIIDNGQGISQDILEKIFIPFFTTKKNGSGIGLSLARQIMRSHGGSIRVSSKPDEETVFTLRF
jgi:nitrogen fixation/metabolism regulation signal transduction histidine kinase